jgi:glycosyltransferase involved in cell wall biosynthesis
MVLRPIGRAKFGARQEAVAMSSPHLTASRCTVFVDANPLADKHLTGIGRYTARITLALAKKAIIRFISQGQEVIPPAGLSWDQDQDLGAWGRGVWKGRREPLSNIPRDSIGLYCCLRPTERAFPFEVSVLHDFTPLVVPHTHSEKTRGLFRGFFSVSLPSSDAAIAVSHSTKADAAWLCDMPQDKITVAHSGPSVCVERHFHAHPVVRKPNVGLVVSTLEPRKNAFFLLEWFKNTNVLPPDTELWWVGPRGWLTSRRKLRAYQNLQGRRVRFLGVVSDAQLCELYQTAGWSIYPSLYEGFGFPVLDSLRHGTPVLTSYNSALREFITPGVFFFDPCDASTLDTAWETFRAANPVTIDRESLDAHYRWDRVAEKLLGLAPVHAEMVGSALAVRAA